MINKLYVWRSAKMIHRTNYLPPNVTDYRIEYKRLNTSTFSKNGGHIEKTVDDFLLKVSDEALYELQESARSLTRDEFMNVMDNFLAKNPDLDKDVPDSCGFYGIWLTAVYSVLRYSIYDKSQIPA